MLKYKIKSKDENGIVTLEKTGHKIHFTMDEVAKHQALLEKEVKEITAKREVERAKMFNIEGFHSIVKELKEEDMVVVHLYQEAKAMEKACTNYITEREKQIQEYKDEVEEIKKQLPELNV